MYRHLQQFHRIASSVVATSLGLILFAVIASAPVFADTVDSGAYGEGGYGNCLYGTCPLSLTSSSTVGLDVTPSGAGKCTVHSDSVTATTDNTTGFSLTATTSTTNTNMVSGANTIAASSGTPASPITLINNTWGYRVDSAIIGTFGTGPTSGQDSQDAPAVTFAGMPASNGTPATLRNYTTTASAGISTPVWYGICASTSKPTGNYTVDILYTAVLNN